MALTIDSILPAAQEKNAGETIEITTAASGNGGGFSRTVTDFSPFVSDGSDGLDVSTTDTTLDYNSTIGNGYCGAVSETVLVGDISEIGCSFDFSTTAVSGITYFGVYGLDDVGTPITIFRFVFRNDLANVIAFVGDINITESTASIKNMAVSFTHENGVSRLELTRSGVLFLVIDTPVDLSGYEDLRINIGVQNNESVSITNFSLSGEETIRSLSYQYNKDGSPISGATANPYTKTAEDGDSGSYTCTVSDGVDTVTSDAVSVVVNVPQTKSGTVEIDGTPIKFRSYTPSPLVSYKLKPMSNGSMRNVDRGLETDSFTTSVTFRGTVDERDELLAILKNARDARTPLTMENFAVPLFGDHVDYTNPITVYVVSQTVPTMADSAKTQSFTVVFKIDGQVDTSGDDTIPSLSCARYTTRGGYNQNAILLSSYTQAHSLIDMELDTPTFTGEYDMSPVDTARLLRFWRLRRGEAFQVQDLGTINPFGERFNAPYIVYIISVEVEPMFNNLRRVKLTLSLRS